MSEEKMRAAWFESFGEASQVLVLGDLPRSKPAAGEVLIRMRVSAVNPSDVKKRAGAFPHLLDEGLVIPHSDGAGIIEAVGEGVDAERIGQRVWVYQAQYARRLGTAAQFLSIDESRAIALPASVPFEIGACLGIPVMTSHRCVFADGPVDGLNLLVTGGAGRVGYYAIQWARAAGANVFATASNEADEALCRSLGAIHVVNHRDPDWAEQLLNLTGEKMDRVIDVEFGINLESVLTLIKTSGVIATYSSTQVREPSLPFLQMMFMDLTIRMVIVYAMPESAKREAIEDITKALENNQLQHRIAHRVRLDEVAKSHQLIEQGGFGGCVVIEIEQS